MLKLKGEVDRRKSEERSEKPELGMSKLLSTCYGPDAVPSALDVLINLIFATV